MDTDHLFKLAHEYRPTMDAEVLHDWAMEVVSAVTGDPYTPKSFT
jgi:hypothetical protein